jgi:hypothetical protein
LAADSAANVGLAAFAQRVQQVASGLATPPLTDAVSIAQVYDAYGGQHADAGGLEAFKERLLAASTRGLLELRTLDEPRVLDNETRVRSELQGRNRRYHLILYKNS